MLYLIIPPHCMSGLQSQISCSTISRFCQSFRYYTTYFRKRTHCCYHQGDDNLSNISWFVSL